MTARRYAAQRRGSQAAMMIRYGERNAICVAKTGASGAACRSVRIRRAPPPMPQPPCRLFDFTSMPSSVIDCLSIFAPPSRRFAAPTFSRRRFSRRRFRDHRRDCSAAGVAGDAADTRWRRVTRRASAILPPSAAILRRAAVHAADVALPPRCHAHTRADACAAAAARARARRDSARYASAFIIVYCFFTLVVFRCLSIAAAYALLRAVMAMRCLRRCITATSADGATRCQRRCLICPLRHAAIR